VAYAKMKEGSVMNSKSMRRRLAELVPEFMIPSQFVFDHALTITENGKIDRTKVLRHIHQGSNESG
jgi:hypothetical protein